MIAKPTSTFNLEAQRLLKVVVRNPESDRLAEQFLINHDAADLLEMIGLT